MAARVEVMMVKGRFETRYVSIHKYALHWWRDQISVTVGHLLCQGGTTVDRVGIDVAGINMTFINYYYYLFECN